VRSYADAEVLCQSVLEAWSSMANAETLQHFDGVEVKLVFFKQQVGCGTRQRRRGVPGCAAAARHRRALPTS
jgi:hypothetical protein